MAERIEKRGLDSGRVLTSTARRARDTAAALVSTAGDCISVVHDPDIYLAAPGTLLAVLSRQSNAVETIVLVGHNPGLTQLANMLLPELRLDNLPTAGVVAMRLPGADWADIGAQPARLEYYDYPKNSAAV